MEQRRKLRTEVENQKLTIMAKFEQMKKQGSGKMSPQDISALIGTGGEGQVGAFTVEQTVGTASAQPTGPWKGKSTTKPSKPSAVSAKDAKAAEMMGKEKIGLLRKQQNEELLQILEDEQQREAGREQQLAAAASDIERNRLDKIFGLERAKSSQRIVSISE